MAFICCCQAVTTRTVREAMARGAETVEEIGELCGAGTTCFGCHPTLERLLEADAARARRGTPVRVRGRSAGARAVFAVR